MPDRYDESELLAYVEDALAPRRARKLEDLLADDPETRALLEQLRADRALLASTPDPELPADFLAQLEPQLARPMLMDQQPGQYRRRHQRKAMNQRVRRFAPAAVLLFAASGALWAAYVGLAPILIGPGDGDAIVSNTDGANPSGAPVSDSGTGEARSASRTGADAAVWPPEGTTIHHGRPLPPGSGDGALVRSGGDGPARARATTAPPVTLDDGKIVASFALVIPAENVQTAELTLQRVLEGFSDPSSAASDGALVQNFSYEEARRLVMSKRAAPGGRTPDAISSIPGADTRRMSREERNRSRQELARLMRSLRAGPTLLGGDEQFSRQLCGPESLAPSYECQLELAGRGATHTIAISASYLNELLTRLSVDEGRQTTLRELPAEADAAPAGAGTAIGAWASDFEVIRAFRDQLRDRPDAVVLLPVIIESEPGRTPRGR